MVKYFSVTYLKMVLSAIWHIWKKIGAYISRFQSGLILGLIYIFIITLVKWIAFNKKKKLENDEIWQTEEDSTIDFNRPW